ncbi:MAG: hypothetical protein JSR80_01070 [Verrucomicrobia bacterium]|nr:hypothetical protein [Verrucomicrobiota bacterium]
MEIKECCQAAIPNSPSKLLIGSLGLFIGIGLGRLSYSWKNLDAKVARIIQISGGVASVYGLYKALQAAGGGLRILAELERESNQERAQWKLIAQRQKELKELKSAPALVGEKLSLLVQEVQKKIPSNCTVFGCAATVAVIGNATDSGCYEYGLLSESKDFSWLSRSANETFPKDLTKGLPSLAVLVTYSLEPEGAFHYIQGTWDGTDPIECVEGEGTSHKAAVNRSVGNLMEGWVADTLMLFTFVKDLGLSLKGTDVRVNLGIKKTSQGILDSLLPPKNSEVTCDYKDEFSIRFECKKILNEKIREFVNQIKWKRADEMEACCTMTWEDNSEARWAYRKISRNQSGQIKVIASQQGKGSLPPVYVIK